MPQNFRAWGASSEHSQQTQLASQTVRHTVFSSFFQQIKKLEHMLSNEGKHKSPKITLESWHDKLQNFLLVNNVSCSSICMIILNFLGFWLSFSHLNFTWFFCYLRWTWSTCSALLIAGMFAADWMMLIR